MRKEAPIKSKLLQKLLVFVFVLGLFSFVAPKSAHALTCEDDIPWYRIGTHADCMIKRASPIISIARTMEDAAKALLTDFIGILVVSTTPEDIGVCTVALGKQLGVLDSSCTLSGSTELFDQLATEAEEAAETIGCEFNSPEFFFGGRGQPGDLTEVTSRTEGSLMGMTSLAYVTAVHEEPNVNLAYFVQDTAQRIPVINQTAYAQETSYGAWGLEVVLKFWQKSRNIAFAMMSVIMLVIGIMIITRRKINPQTVVTVQTALPRVVISLFLIVFSYPIGAIMASMVNVLTVMVMQVFFADFIGELFNMNVLVFLIGNIMFVLGGGGLLGTFVALILLIITLVAMLAAFVKIIFINLKILIQIMFAPLQFAIAAIPGQENLISDWFKQMIAKVLAIPSIVFMVALGWYLLVVPVLDPGVFTNSVVGCAGGGVPDVLSLASSTVKAAQSTALTIVMLPLMSIMTMFAGVKMDKTIENLIVGPKKK